MLNQNINIIKSTNTTIRNKSIFTTYGNHYTALNKRLIHNDLNDSVSNLLLLRELSKLNRYRSGADIIDTTKFNAVHFWRFLKLYFECLDTEYQEDRIIPDVFANITLHIEEAFNLCLDKGEKLSHKTLQPNLYSAGSFGKTRLIKLLKCVFVKRTNNGYEPYWLDFHANFLSRYENFKYKIIFHDEKSMLNRDNPVESLDKLKFIFGGQANEILLKRDNYIVDAPKHWIVSNTSVINKLRFIGEKGIHSINGDELSAFMARIEGICIGSIGTPDYPKYVFKNALTLKFMDRNGRVIKSVKTLSKFNAYVNVMYMYFKTFGYPMDPYWLNEFYNENNGDRQSSIKSLLSS